MRADRRSVRPEPAQAAAIRGPRAFRAGWKVNLRCLNLNGDLEGKSLRDLCPHANAVEHVAGCDLDRAELGQVSTRVVRDQESRIDVKALIERVAGYDPKLLDGVLIVVIIRFVVHVVIARADREGVRYLKSGASPYGAYRRVTPGGVECFCGDEAGEGHVVVGSDLSVPVIRTGGYGLIGMFEAGGNRDS